MKLLFTFSACILSAVFLSSATLSRTQEPKKIYQRSGNEGSITGTIAFTGDPPGPYPIDMSADMACARMNQRPVMDDLITTNGFVANVLVYVKASALDEFTFEAPTARVILDQRGCWFVPRVVGLQTSQLLEIRNSDPTTHNIHPRPKKNSEWNVSQPAGAVPLLRKFAVPELIPIKSNQHPWMRAYAAVFAHPFFGVTGQQGAFSIDGLPPGTYTLIAWHERLGEKTLEVTVSPGSSQHLHISFDVLNYKEWD
jgi:hypothetical protein